MKIDPMGYVDEETGEYVMPARPRPAPPPPARATRAERNVTPPPPDAFEVYVSRRAAQARREAERYWTLAARGLAGAAGAYFASWRLGWPLVVVCIACGAYALWQAEHAFFEERLGRSA